MSQWQRTLDLKDIWNKANNEEISTEELARGVAERLSKLKPIGIAYIDELLITLVCEFEFLSDEENLSFDAFNRVFENVYDWGDISLDNKFGGRKVCWIKTLL